ncbi:UDP-N-acetylmuramoyl-tripeptide--D-alanyl-D-alanine ligase [Paenibacillus aurantius]|uniref:UDP-N-acetylmuramoyl-tripeptide--D-alanyl-D-alanine ligase n=1 Tax=Paenibacillus aurantius TaxID=2918900 RepID=A0AA96RG02_9BACL|nr:UDP-N-acetylmuramoyl-tripeptide--D-alanyl-D-alanine ligase [Paenibacillus aurantius]WNQ11803.1 UDP-N-acetylmuramoyl-tripeptide--D-alanyl-D-alanine ligase [Paenibacillus aurantius]
MIQKRLKAIEQMTGGKGLSPSYDDITIEGVSIDSRTVKPGNLFIPLIRQLDGHHYVEEAIAKGAAASLWQTDHPSPPHHLPLIYVDDGLQALQKLAAAYRGELPVTTIAVTGSNGKTTTKDILTSVLQTNYRVHKTLGNLNSQIGVPLTLLEIDKDSEVAVIEMGMSERGQIDRLSRMVQPDIAVITMIGVSHLSTLGSREEIANAKLEIVNGLKDGGTLIYNGDEPLLAERVQEVIGSNAVSLIRIGEAEHNEYRAEIIKSDAEGSSFKVRKEEFHLPILGAHNISNALCATAAAYQLGLGPEQVAEGFTLLQVTKMRMEKIDAPRGFTILNDAWNASPVSMASAIETFQDLPGYIRKFAVLGDMLELGPKEQEFHREIGWSLDPRRMDYVYTVGELAAHIAQEAAKRFPEGKVKAFASKEEAAEELWQNLNPQDLVLVKGSRGMQLESMVSRLMQSP